MQKKSHIGLLRVSSQDAKKFLQGQLTCDLDNMTVPQLGAHCNPQGRVISLFYISKHQDGYDLQMPRESIPLAIKALQKYAVFFKATLTDASDESIQFDSYELIKKCIPSIYPETSEKFLPHDLNLPALGAISFNKGCYTGQEIIARMHYRGKPKNHLYRARVNTHLPLVRGHDIFSGDKIAGTLVDYCKISDNRYDLLVITQETQMKNTVLFIDPENKNNLEFL